MNKKHEVTSCFLLVTRLPVCLPPLPVVHVNRSVTFYLLCFCRVGCLCPEVVHQRSTSCASARVLPSDTEDVHHLSAAGKAAFSCSE